MAENNPPQQNPNQNPINPSYIPPVNPAPPTNTKAIISLVLGVISFMGCILTGPIALWLGLSARKEIRSSNGAQTGDGLAMAGVIIGAIATGLMVLFLGFLLIYMFIIGGALLMGS